MDSRIRLEKVIVSLSESHVTSKDIVTPKELEAFEKTMEKAGVEVELHHEMPDALQSSLEQVKPGDLIVMGGAQGMDFGAKYILNQLVEMKPELDAEATLAPLKERVAGIDESFLNKEDAQ